MNDIKQKCVKLHSSHRDIYCEQGTATFSFHNARSGCGQLLCQCNLKWYKEHATQFLRLVKCDAIYLMLNTALEQLAEGSGTCH